MAYGTGPALNALSPDPNGPPVSRDFDRRFDIRGRDPEQTKLTAQFALRRSGLDGAKAYSAYKGLVDQDVLEELLVAVLRT
jgi:hypothetical protein